MCRPFLFTNPEGCAHAFPAQQLLPGPAALPQSHGGGDRPGDVCHPTAQLSLARTAAALGVWGDTALAAQPLSPAGPEAWKSHIQHLQRVLWTRNNLSSLCWHLPQAGPDASKPCSNTSAGSPRVRVTPPAQPSPCSQHRPLAAHGAVIPTVSPLLAWPSHLTGHCTTHSECRVVKTKLFSPRFKFL